MKQMDDPRQISLLPPATAEIMHLVRENLRLLIDLANQCEVSRIDVAGDVRTVRGPADVVQYLEAEMAPLAQEQLRVANLDTKNHLLSTSLVYQGGLNATVIRLADCFREAVRVGAAAVILVHNHPSGDPTPSPEDIRLTAEAGHVGELLGIDVLDHIVIGRPGFVSLRERGLYTPNHQPLAARLSRPYPNSDPAA